MFRGVQTAIRKFATWGLVVFVVSSFALTSARAQSVLVDEGQLFVDQEILKRTIGIEIEFVGVPDEKIKELILKHFGGVITQNDISKDTLFKTQYGEIKLKIEGSAWRFEDDPDKFAQARRDDIQKSPREVVFPPVLYSQFHQPLENFVKELQQAGALGTTENRAVSFQVNVQMAPLLEAQKNVDDLVNLMRAYLRPEHRAQIEQLLHVPSIRSEFLNDYSPGFMKRLLDPNYRPTAREFYDDFLYRQSLELLGDANAWTDSISDVQSKLLGLGADKAVLPRVVKMSKLRISSLLLMAFPEDPLSKWIVESKWARPAPIVEFREFNNTFNAGIYIRMALGIVRAAQKYGFYLHDHLITQLTGVTQGELKQLRSIYNLRPGISFFDFHRLLSNRPKICRDLFLAIEGVKHEATK